MKFYQMSVTDRRKLLLEKGLIKNLELPTISSKELAQISENVIGELTFPVGVVTDFVINNKSYDVPMATEESSVVAAANKAAKIFGEVGGVAAKSERNGIVGQIVMEVEADFDDVMLLIEIGGLIQKTNAEFASLVEHGGGLKEIQPNVIDNLLELEVLIDPAASMGANKINSILEFLSDQLLEIPGIKQKLFAILSNAPSQLATASVKIPIDKLDKNAAEKIAFLSKFGQENKLRAPTNNKGIMNGVDAVVIATGNDFRAVEAATQDLAVKNGSYQSLSSWKIVDGQLVGTLTISLPIGVVGGSIQNRPDVMENLEILGNLTAKELSKVIAAVGLASNFAALLAIVTTGIQAGHMKLQLRNQIQQLDATPMETDELIKRAIDRKKYDSFFLRNELTKIRNGV